jgi:hypothetical protein
MSVVATAIVLGLVVVALIRTRWVRFSGAVVCVVFGLVLGATPAGPAVNGVLTDVGAWLFAQLQSV